MCKDECKSTTADAKEMIDMIDDFRDKCTESGRGEGDDRSRLRVLSLRTVGTNDLPRVLFGPATGVPRRIELRSVTYVLLPVVLLLRSTSRTWKLG